MNFEDLKGKVAVITGGFGILGMALTRGLAAAGVNVAVISRSAGESGHAEKIAQEFGIKCIGISASTLSCEELERALSVVHESLGTVDILINCAGGNSPKATCKLEQMEVRHSEVESAGIFRHSEGSVATEESCDLEGSFYGLDMDGFQQVFDLNFKGTVLATMIFTRDMLAKGKGGVLNISSMNSIRPLTKIPAYSAAKASINNFTQWYAVHVAQTGIRCNAIAPGFFLTDQNRFLLTDPVSGALTPRGEKIIASTPVHKFGQPEDLVGITLFLLSDASSFINGVVVPVDGGYSAYGGV